MARYTRKTAILAALEATYKTDATPTGANTLLISNQTINPLNANNVDRDIVRPYFGASEQLVGTAFKEITFDIELVGSGTPGQPPAWGPLLQACGYEETVETDTRVDYTPTTDDAKSVTLYYYDDGVLHKLLGARGDFTLNGEVGNRPVLSFRFIGCDGGDTAATAPTLDLSAWMTPQVVTDANSGDINIGGTINSTGEPAITGGATVASGGIVINCGNDLQFTPLLGLESVDITNRQVTGNIRLDLSASDEVTAMAAVKAATLTALSWIHGTVPGRRVMIHAPGVQRINPSKQELNGRRLIGFDLRFVPNSGNDELRIVTSF